ncbi:hypothetical protein CK203_052599 [Vitis vinifera]|uniref:Uncharacterized protein n=1 Tax=Vitis vinifera TaxID=29760 RepID=A0A438FVX5_VITVI|nr:hypothetical protein CK203_052599 [Vitis vinifera]
MEAMARDRYRTVRGTGYGREPDEGAFFEGTETKVMQCYAEGR